MKSKTKIIAVFGLLIVCMSSCVYSLFPIYTEETLVFLPELNGKWLEADNEGNYIVFESNAAIEASVSIKENIDSPKNQAEVSQEWSIDFGEYEFIIINGDTVRDPDVIKAYWESELKQLGNDLSEGMSKFAEGLAAAIDGINNRKINFSQDAKSYTMKIYDNYVLNATFLVHVVDIDNELYLDLYPSEEVFDLGVSNNLFPVHTFMKLEFEKDELKTVQFDLDKLNKLFDSNLIRMRHENVEGTILITAQPEEIQKFLSKYADD
jgi:hypothetical protein